MRWRGWIGLWIGLLCALMATSSARAHANLARSVPAANSVLSNAPSEIRLFFTEPLEPAFSRITLLGSDGAAVATQPSFVDTADPYQLVLPLTLLTGGIYTVTWEVVSAADNHRSQGSFAFTIGMPGSRAATGATGVQDTIALDGTLVRWLNLVSLSILFGALAFGIWVSQMFTRSLVYLSWIGWAAVGATTVLLLLHHLLAVTGGLNTFGVVVLETRFGAIWLGRLLLLLMTGVLLVLHRYLPAFLFSAGVLFSNSLISHAAASANAPLLVVNDGLHLFASAVWIGGLVALLITAVAVRRAENLSSMPTLSQVVGRFSNLARLSVLMLIVTGAVAGLAQVGSLEALLTTRYGQALLIKQALFLPTLALAGVNLLVTRSALKEGDAVWVGRLRQLVTAEIVLLIGALGAVGAMTSTNPAREVVAQRALIAENAALDPVYLMQNEDDLHVHLEIAPGTVGENSFIVRLYDVATGDAIVDATRIRLRFETRAASIGRSELRPEFDPATQTYRASGANLSVAGEWSIRVTVQRPDRFDTLADFSLNVSSPA